MLTQELEKVQAEARHAATRRVFQAKEETMLSEEGKAHVEAARRAARQATQRSVWWVTGQTIKIYSKFKMKVMEWHRLGKMTRSYFHLHNVPLAAV